MLLRRSSQRCQNGGPDLQYQVQIGRAGRPVNFVLFRQLTPSGPPSPKAIALKRARSWETRRVSSDPKNPSDDESDGSPEEPAEPSDDVDDAAAPLRGLEGFSILQRQLAGINFTAFDALQRAIPQFPQLPVPQLFAVQDAITKHFAQTIQFSRLAAMPETLVEASGLAAVSAIYTQWAESLASAVDFSALTRAFASSAALTAYSGFTDALAETFKQQTDVWSKIAEGLRFDLPRLHFDISGLVEGLNRWIPGNLRHVEDIDGVAIVALDEGLPLSWIPRREIVVALVSAPSGGERQAILIQRSAEVLDDCEAALAADDCEWARECKAAVAALRAGLFGPAQSHASNIIDSIVMDLFGPRGRDEAKKRAEAEFDDLPLQLAAENLTVRPLFRAFTPWWPASGIAPPDHFARHATSHAVGHVGVFTPQSALVAVMLATSLTVQYSDGEFPPPEEAPIRITD